MNLSLDFNKGSAISGNQQLGNILSNTFQARNMPNSYRQYTAGSIDGGLLSTARTLMHDDHHVKYQTLMSNRSKTGGTAGLYLPHLKPKNPKAELALSPRVMSIGSSDGSPRVKKSIFSPVL